MQNKLQPVLRRKMLHGIVLLAFLSTFWVGNPASAGAQSGGTAISGSGAVPIQVSPQNVAGPEANDKAGVRVWYDTQGDLWVETPFYRWNITGGTSITALKEEIEYPWSANSPGENARVIDQFFLSAPANFPTETRIFYALPDEAVIYLERTTTGGVEGLEIAFRSSDGQIRFTHRWQGPDLPASPRPQESPLISDSQRVEDQNGMVSSRDQNGAAWGYSSSFDPSAGQGQSLLWKNDIPPVPGHGSSCFTGYPSQEPAVHDPCQFPNFFLPGQVLGTEYLLIYTADSTAPFKPVETAIAALDLNLPDLNVANFTRTPRYDFNAAKTNPAPGDTVTFTARVANRGGQPTGVFQYIWYVDQVPVQSSSHASLNPGDLITLSLNWTWQDGPHTVQLKLDPSNAISEVSEQNNSLTDRTNGLAVGFWVEQSVYDYFNLHQVELGLGSVSWDDWAQRHIRVWNQMMADAVHPLTPQGIIDRVRLDKVTVVPDGSLPDPYPSNWPDLSDKTVDMMWGFVAESVDPGQFYTWPDIQNFDPGLLHELSHARYLIDLYGLNVALDTEHLADNVSDISTTLTVRNSVENYWYLPVYLAIEGELVICRSKSGSTFTDCLRGAEGTTPRAHAVNAIVNEASIRVQDGKGNLIMASPALPLVSIWDDHLYYNRYPNDLMSGFTLKYETHSAYAWNLIAGKRPVCGNYNAPCNLGIYLNDLPAHNLVEVHDISGQPIQGARVEIFEPKPGRGYCRKLYMSNPDATYNTDASGRADLGHFPFDTVPPIDSASCVNGDLLLKISYGGLSFYRFFEITEANEAYWSGQHDSATYVLETPFNPYNCVRVTEIPLAECQALVALYNNTQGMSWVNHTNWLNTTTPCSWYGVLCSGGHVVSLFLYSNQLSGNIPVELGNLSQITVVDLSRNQLTGSIPKQLGNLLALERLSLDNNQLTGTIPTELGNLKHLTDLALSDNLLTGSIPSELGNMPQLMHVWLHNNQLTGIIPPQIGNLTHLRYLHLHHNRLSGSIPPVLGNLTDLEYLLLGSNQLSGSIPKELGQLVKLAQLDLGDNQLTGSIPPELGNLTELEFLGLNNNQLTGGIPSELGNLTQLLSLWLSTNQLSGGIPSEFGNLSQLAWLVLNDNQLSGSIPAQLGNLPSLERLYLYNNRLTGNIPAELGNLTQLTDLHLNSNKIMGEFPSSITHLVNLKSFAFDCWLTASETNVITFINALVPGWQNKICPVVLSITRGDPTPTNAAMVNFTVTFSESVSGVHAGDFILYTSGITGSSITGVIPMTGTSYKVTAKTGSGNGTIRLDVIDDDGILDNGNNQLGGPGTGNGGFTSGPTYRVIKVPTFTDVSVTHPYWQDIEILYANNMTGGCATNPLKFCPDQIMNRAQAAAFMLRGNFGQSYVPPVPQHIFMDDWSKGPWAEAWAEGMRNEGFSAGCLANPLKYCPWDQIPREQAVIFALKLKYGKLYTPPQATGTVFTDMTNPNFYATAWAEKAYADGIIQNCGIDSLSGKPKFCPKTMVTRGLAAYMIVRAKSLSMP